MSRKNFITDFQRFSNHQSISRRYVLKENVNLPGVEYYADRLTSDKKYDKRDMNKVDKIIVHHTAGPKSQSIERVHNYHKGKGWPRVAYHFWIDEDGRIFQLNDVDTKTFHAGKSNSSSIGIVLPGYFHPPKNHVPSQAQLDSLYNLVNQLESKYGSKNVVGHRDVSSTSCPGDNLYPYVEMINRGQKPVLGDVELENTGDSEEKLVTYYSDESKSDVSDTPLFVTYMGKEYERPSPSEFVEDDVILFDGMPQGRMDRKNEVMEIQQLLIDRNYKLPNFGVDGKFGPETLAAVNAFQTDHGLTVKGVVDEEMMNELEVETNINQNPQDNDPQTVQRYQLQPWEQPVVQAIKDAAEEYGIDVKDAMVIAEVESSGNPNVKNAGGCIGLYQFCPRWIKGYGLNSQSALDPYQNSLAFAKSIRKRIDNFKSKYGREPELHETYIMWNQGESGANQIFDAVSEGTGVPRRIRRNMRAQGSMFSDDPVEFVEAMKKFVQNKQSQFESRGIKI